METKKFKCEKCKYSTDHKHHLKTHMIHSHDECVKYYVCDFENCNHKSKSKSHLNTHKKYVHNVIKKWYNCNQESCDKKFKCKIDLKEHLINVHDIGDIKWYHCKDCEYKTKIKGNIKQHKITSHSKIVKQHYCNQENCNFKTHLKGNLKQHKQNVHNINTKWHSCNLCDLQFKRKSLVENHKQNIHGINVVYHKCDLCELQFKQKGQLKNHKSYVHNINVKWHYCIFPNCDSKFKFNRDLNKHTRCLHTTEGQARQKKEEQKVARLLEKNDITFERETRINFDCFDSGKNYARIDFTIYKKDCVILLEVDENQHKYGYTVSCDMKRMNHVLAAIRAQGNNQTVLFLRYNPNTCKIDNKIVRFTQKKRQEELMKFLNSYSPSREGLEIKYLFYDQENETPFICKTEEYKLKECVI